MYLKIICYSLAVLLPVMYLIYMAPGDAGQAKQARKFREEIEKNEEFPLPGELVIYETIIRFSERHDCSLLGWRALNVAFVNSE